MSTAGWHHEGMGICSACSPNFLCNQDREWTMLFPGTESKVLLAFNTEELSLSFELSPIRCDKIGKLLYHSFMPDCPDGLCCLDVFTR